MKIFLAKGEAKVYPIKFGNFMGTLKVIGIFKELSFLKRRH